MGKVRLIDIEDLQRSLTVDAGVFNQGLAVWSIEVVSAAALQITGRNWKEPLDVPPGAMAVLALAVRRLYTNPDRFTREAEGDYSYGLDASVTKASIFTPDEKAVLEEFSTKRRLAGLASVSTFRGDLRCGDTIYVPDGTVYGFPWYREEGV